MVSCHLPPARDCRVNSHVRFLTSDGTAATPSAKYSAVRGVSSQPAPLSCGCRLGRYFTIESVVLTFLAASYVNPLSVMLFTLKVKVPALVVEALVKAAVPFVRVFTLVVLAVRPDHVPDTVAADLSAPVASLTVTTALAVVPRLVTVLDMVMPATKTTLGGLCTVITTDEAFERPLLSTTSSEEV